MNLRISVVPNNLSWHANIALEGALTPAEQAARSAFGPCIVQAGGDFDGSALGGTYPAVTFTLDEREAGLPDGLPVDEVFTGEDAGEKAAVWAQSMLVRCNDAVALWLANSQEWRRETLHTIPS